ncbi:MAG: hypothetical protein GKS05_04250 [Nitrospirales bacterium]|nr:hypothetical protein [Nitrospirales bacterium]
MCFPSGTNLTKPLTDKAKPEHFPTEYSNLAEIDLPEPINQAAEHVYGQIYCDGAIMEYGSIILHTMAHHIKRERQPNIGKTLS